MRDTEFVIEEAESNEKLVNLSVAPRANDVALNCRLSVMEVEDARG
jgi:hypothetical protein